MDNIRIDGVIWNISGVQHRFAQPLCPKHFLRLHTPGEYSEYSTRTLICDDCEKSYVLPRFIANEKKYILDKIDSKIFKAMKIINLDDEAIPLAKEELKSDDNKYFVTGLLTKSKVGLRLVIYAGEKGKSEKTQIFVEPEIKRLAFDQKDIHPSDVFVELEATFKDGTKNSIKN